MVANDARPVEWVQQRWDLPAWQLGSEKATGRVRVVSSTDMDGCLDDGECYVHVSPGVHAWRDAIDVSNGSADTVVLFHCTNPLACSNITHSAKQKAEVPFGRLCFHSLPTLGMVPTCVWQGARLVHIPGDYIGQQPPAATCFV